MAAALQLPFRHGAPEKVGRRLWRKQVLPVGRINYKGQVLDFTPDYLGNLASAFNARAYDQVPFLLADPANRHNMDVERFRGEVKAMELAEDGLYLLLSTTKDGTRVLQENPRLGVSARIVTDLAKADGRHFPAAIQHVLGTLDPRVTGMKPWEAVDLSNDLPVVDLTAATYEGEHTMELTDEEVQGLRALLDAQGKDPEPTANESDPDFDEEAFEREVAEALAAAGVEPDEENDPEPVGASLSAEALAAIELANVQSGAALEGQSVLQAELAAERFRGERRALLSAGVPPAILDLAEPLLAGSHIIDLADGESVDASEIVRQMLHEYKGLVDLSGETPAAMEPTDDEKDLLDQWAAEAGD